MAHVGISGKLISEVNNAVSLMAEKERNVLMAQLHETTPCVNDRLVLSACIEGELVALLWGDHAHLRNAIPEHWCTTLGDFQVMWYEDVISVSSGEPVSTRMFFTIADSSEFKLPPDTRYGNLKVPRRPSFADKYVEYVNARNRVSATIKTKYNAITNQVVTYLQSCKSLNAAVKALPGINLYIPKYYLDRMEVKVTRSATTNADEHAYVVDTALIVSTAVMHKFLGEQT